MMRNFIAIIDGRKGAYGAVFPDAPGCTAMGVSMQEVFENAVTALREWAADRIGDGMSLPEPRSFEEIVDDPDWLEQPGASAVVPLLLDAGRTVRANISIDAGLLEQIDAAAKLRGLTRSAFLASAAREKIAEQR